MALKPDRQVSMSQKAFCLKPMCRGAIVTYEKKQNAQYPLVGLHGDNVAGILLDDVVDIDLTRHMLQFDQTQVGGLVDIMVRGMVTIKLGKGLRAPIGHPVFVKKDTGKPTLIQWGPQIGRLLSKIDKDGFAKVEINI